MLKSTKMWLELIPDPDIYILFEKDICWKSFYPKQESKYIIYLDRSKLYGYTMSKFLATIRFKRIDPKKFDLNEYTSIV